MTDKQDSSDEIQSMSRKFQSITTTDTSANTHVPTRNNQFSATMNNNSSAHSPVEGGKTCTAHQDDNLPARTLPEINLPEKIVFIIDRTQEQDCTHFKLGTGAKYPPLFMIKRVVEIFVTAKSTIGRLHEFALMTLDSGSVNWLCDFTNNTKTVLNHLDTLAEDAVEEDCETFDLGQVFEMVHSRVPLPISGDPLHLTRAILIYTRSHCIPKFLSGRDDFERLTENPYFVLDSLLVHEPPTPENNCEEVYAELTALDGNNVSYILEVGRNATKLHDNMAKLLAHPLQRPLQRNANYSVYSLSASQEVHTKV